MTTRQDSNPFAGVEVPDPGDPLDMALNTLWAVSSAAAVQGHPDGMVRIQGEVFHVGAQAMTSAKLGAYCALISLAADVRRIADALAPHMGPE